MTIGTGTDLIEISRIERAIGRNSFLMRVFTEEECRQAKGKSSFLAGCFAVKEAVAKCFGTGFSGFTPKDIEVLRDKKGKPYVKLYSGAARIFEEIGGREIFVSISDTKSLALAFAVMEGSGRRAYHESV